MGTGRQSGREVRDGTASYRRLPGKYEYDPEAAIFHGRVVNIADTVTFEGRDREELERAMRESLEDYEEFTREMGAHRP